MRNVHLDETGEFSCTECGVILDTDWFTDDELADETAWILCDIDWSEALAEEAADRARQG